MCYHPSFQTPHYDATQSRLIEFAFCTHLSKHVTMYREHVEQVDLLPPCIRFLLFKVFCPIVLECFFGLVLVRYAIHPPLLLSLLPTCRKYCIIPKCYKIIRPHLQRNHQAPMHQTLSLMLIYFFQSTCHETPTTYS